MKIKKERKKSRCIILYNARIKILNKSASFTTKCIMATTRVTEKGLIKTCIPLGQFHSRGQMNIAGIPC